MKKIVITGGPCSGKSSVLEAIASQEYSTLPESAREIIYAEKAKSKIDPTYQPILPHTNLIYFQRLVAEKQKKYEQTCSAANCTANSAITFLDRSLVDCIAYLELEGIKPSSLDFDLLTSIKDAKYHLQVFFLEQLPYLKDDARHEDSELAKKVHKMLYHTYLSLGYQVIVVPTFEGESVSDSINKRAQFILQRAGE